MCVATMLPEVHVRDETFKIHPIYEMKFKYFGLLLSIDFNRNNSDSCVFSEK